MASRIKSNIVSLGFIQIAGFLLPFLALPHLSQSLSTAGFGKYITLLTIIAIANVISDYGYVTNGVRMVAQNQDTPTTVSLIIRRSTSVRLLMSMAAYIVYLLISVFSFRFDTIIHIIVFLSLMTNALVLPWLFQGLGKLSGYSFFSIVSRTFCLLLIFAFINSEEDILLAIFLNVLPQMLSVGYYLIFIRRNSLKLTVERNLSIIRQEFRDGLYFFLPSVYSTFFTGTGIIALGLFKDPSVVGIYAVSDRIIKACVSMSGVVSQALYPTAAEKMRHSNEEGIEFIKRMAKIFIPIFAVFCIILSVFGDSIIKLLFGNNFLTKPSIMNYFPLYILLANINSFIGIMYLTTSGKEAVYSKAFMYGTTVALIIYFLLPSLISYHAPAVGLILGELMILLYIVNYIRRKNV